MIPSVKELQMVYRVNIVYYYNSVARWILVNYILESKGNFFTLDNALMLELPINRFGKYTKFHIQKMEFAFSNKMTSCKLIKTQFNISFMQDYNFLVLITDQISKNVYIMFIKLVLPHH